MENTEQAPIIREGYMHPISPESKIFETKYFTLILSINKDSLDLSSIREKAEEDGYDEKDELHITIIGFKNGTEVKKILKNLSPGDKQLKLTEIQTLIENTDWSFIRKDKAYHISKEYKTPDPNNTGADLLEVRESYIQIVDLPSIENFYKDLNGILGSSIKAPLAHITLFTKGTDREKARKGIGINSEVELAQLTPEPV